jgi:hypothetical protein
MKDTLRNFLEGYDEVVAAYYKDRDRYTVVFHQDGGGAFSINETFTSEELAKAFDSWDFVEDWYEVKSRKDILYIRTSGGSCLDWLHNAIDKAWKEETDTED